MENLYAHACIFGLKSYMEHFLSHSSKLCKGPQMLTRKQSDYISYICLIRSLMGKGISVARCYTESLGRADVLRTYTYVRTILMQHIALKLYVRIGNIY